MKLIFKNEIKTSSTIDEKEIIKLLLKQRKIKDLAEFLNPISPLKINLTDFNKKYLTSFKEVIKILKEIKDRQETIVVYSDYDADGITGAAILWETLYLMGFKVMPYVPHRKLEGYGFSIRGIDNIKKQFHPKLIISVDHGISAKEKIAYAKSLGISVIITDHHIKPKEIPDKAEAIFHIPALSGSGVAYFFAKEIYQNFKFKILNLKLLENNFRTDYLALAAIGTIADMVPLIGPSRSIVKHGLEVFSKVKRHGINQILKEAGIENKKITPYEIGFIIGPRINALGRLEHAIDALRLLCTTNEERAFELASKVGSKNKERQGMVKKAVEESIKEVEKSLLISNEKLLILVGKWNEGIIGLIAAKLVEKYYRPTIVLTENNGYLKGSARSIPELDITEFLRTLKDYLIDVGGHKQAAGFTIEKTKLNEFIKKAQKKANTLLKDKDLEPKLEVDLKLPLSKVTLKLAKLLETLEPFGMGNPQPLFCSNMEVVHTQIFGKNNNHLKIFAKDPKNNFPPLELISFFKAENINEFEKEKKTEIIYNLMVDRWGNREILRGKIK